MHCTAVKKYKNYFYGERISVETQNRPRMACGPVRRRQCGEIKLISKIIMIKKKKKKEISHDDKSKEPKIRLAHLPSKNAVRWCC